jgi:hypothetical protein
MALSKILDLVDQDTMEAKRGCCTQIGFEV